MMTVPDTHALQDIAIIGMAGRFPGAATLDQFWNNLRDGIESISLFSEEELISSGVDPALLSEPNYVRAKGVLQDAELFAAEFFGCSPREAQLMDPQHRIFLECCWEALEDAGYDPARHAGMVGVYGGARMNTYVFNLYSNKHVAGPIEALPIILGNDKDYLTTRVSYMLDLQGPSVDVQSACSTSLVAVCLACQALLTYQCDTALAGGVRVSVPLLSGYLYEKEGILSADGHCRPFDAQAQGTVFSDGAGVVVMKRLEDALADRDCIRAIIRAAAINNDGSSKVGWTAPSEDGQTRVITTALDLGAVDADSISYVETHGTGTQMGDPIEIAALTRAYRMTTNRRQFCAVGSVKSNIGHLSAAAGIASLIKTVLALTYREIPPSLNFNRPNPAINFSDTPFYVNSERREWVEQRYPRRAGVSSFGMGGTNAHIILEESPSDHIVANPTHGYNWCDNYAKKK